MATEKKLDSTGTDGRPLRVLISAGEASGDMYGAELMAALRELTEYTEEEYPTSAKRGQIWGTLEAKFQGATATATTPLKPNPGLNGPPGAEEIEDGIQR